MFPILCGPTGTIPAKCILCLFVCTIINPTVWENFLESSCFEIRSTNSWKKSFFINLWESYSPSNFAVFLCSLQRNTFEKENWRNTLPLELQSHQCLCTDPERWPIDMHNLLASPSCACGTTLPSFPATGTKIERKIV